MYPVRKAVSQADAGGMRRAARTELGSAVRASTPWLRDRARVRAHGRDSLLRRLVSSQDQGCTVRLGIPVTVDSDSLGPSRHRSCASWDLGTS